MNEFFLPNKVFFYYHYKSELFYFERFFYLLINVLVILKTTFLYIKNLFYRKVLALNARHTCGVIKELIGKIRNTESSLPKKLVIEKKK